MKKILLAVAGFAITNLSAAVLTCEALKDYDGNSTGTVTIIDASGNEIASGSEVSGTVTITANGDDFSQWVGTFPADAEINGNQISFTMPETDVRVTPVYNGMWVLDENAETMTDGNWTLKICSVKESANDGTKTFTLGVASSKEGLRVEGSGDMDLSRVVVSKDDGKKCNAMYVYGSSIAWATDFIYSLVLPKTLRAAENGMLNAGSVVSVMTNLVMDCPEFTGANGGQLGSWNFSANRKLERVVLKVPKIKTIGNQIFYAAPLSKTNLDEWDLSGVTEISGTFIVASSGDWTNNGLKDGHELKGTIRLPNIKKIGNDAFKNWKYISSIVLGSNSTVEYIGTNAVPSLANLKSLVIGCSPNGCELVNGDKKAITIGPNLSEFVFLSGKPTPFDTTSINWANETCLYIPKTWVDGADSWSELLGETTALDDDEKTAFQNNSKYKGQPLAESKFVQTKFGQTVYCGRTYLPTWGLGAKVVVNVGDERAKDKVRVNGVEAKRHEFLLEPGESVTATAVLENDDAGCTWNCPGNADCEKTYTVTVTNLDTVVCTLWPRSVWTYLPKGTEGNPYENDIITNAYWVLNVKVYNSNFRHLKILNKSNTYGRGGGWISGEGYLDFNGPIVEPGASSGWTITYIDSFALSSIKQIPASQKATMIVYPRTIESLDSQQLNSNDDVSSSVTNLVINAPLAKGKMSGWFAYGMGKLQDMTLKIPNIIRLDGSLFEMMRPANIDFSKWDLSSVTNIGERAFVGYDSKNALPAKGVLRLPKIKAIGKQAFHALAPEEIELGTGCDIKDRATLTLGHAIFDTATMTKSIKFGPYKSVTALDEWVLGNSNIKEMIFEGRWDVTIQDAVDNMLAWCSASEEAKDVTIYASEALDWDKAADALLETEKSLAPAGCMGVYRKDLRKAWIVQRESQYDPKATILILR